MPMIATTASMSIFGFGGLGHKYSGSPGINSGWLGRIGVLGNPTSYRSLNIASKIAVYPANGDIYIIGVEQPLSATYYGFAVCKITATGNIAWQKILGNFNTRVAAQDCCVDSSGNLYWIGTAYGTAGQPTGNLAGGVEDIYFGKYDVSGNKVFVKKLYSSAGSSSAIEFGEGIGYSAVDNTIVITGRISRWNGASLTSNNCMLAKFNTDGSLVWRKNYYPTIGAQLYGKGVDVDSSGNIYISAVNQSDNVGNTLMALDSSGNIRWSKRVRTTQTGLSGIAGYSMVPYRTVTTSSGNVAMAQYGTVTGTLTAKAGSIVTLYNSSGGVVWQKFIDANRASTTNYPSVTNTGPATPVWTYAQNFVGLTRDSSDNIYLATPGRTTWTNDIILVYKFAATTGVNLWTRAIYINSTPPYGSQPTGLACVGNFIYIIGTTQFETTISGGANYIFAKLPVDGTAIFNTGLVISTADSVTYFNVDVGANYLDVPGYTNGNENPSTINAEAGSVYDQVLDVSSLTEYANTMTVQKRSIGLG
jgi:hypothetical protein